MNRMPPATGRVLRNDSGAVLVIAILLMAVMITIIPVAMHLTSADVKRTAEFEGSREAFFIADAGLQIAGNYYQDNLSNDVLKGPDGVFSSVAGGNYSGTGTEIDDNGLMPFGTTKSDVSQYDTQTHKYTEVAFNGGTYKVRVFDNDDSLLCKVGACTAANSDPTLDNDNEPWVDRDGIVFVESIGTAPNGERTTLLAQVRRKLIPSSFIPAAVVMVGPRASIWGANNTFSVSGAGSVGGDGYAIAGGTDNECAGQSGIAIEAAGLTGPAFTDYDTTLTTKPALNPCEAGPDNICIAMTNGARSNVSGVDNDGGTPGTPDPDFSINDQTFTAVEAAKMYDYYVTSGSPDISLPHNSNPSAVSAYVTNPPLPSNWGTAARPVVIHVAGDFNSSVTSSGDGYGVLIVDGNFNMAGNITWNGIVLLQACPTCSGELTGAGNLTINGTTIIGNGSNNISKSTYAGTANFNYSCEGIAAANAAGPDIFAVMSWNEITQ